MHTRLGHTQVTFPSRHSAPCTPLAHMLIYCEGVRVETEAGKGIGTGTGTGTGSRPQSSYLSVSENLQIPLATSPPAAAGQRYRSQRHRRQRFSICGRRQRLPAPFKLLSGNWSGRARALHPPETASVALTATREKREEEAEREREGERKPGMPLMTTFTQLSCKFVATCNGSLAVRPSESELNSVSLSWNGYTLACTVCTHVCVCVSQHSLRTALES